MQKSSLKFESHLSSGIGIVSTILQKKKNKSLSPIPRSGGFSSYLIGLLAVLFCFAILQETAPKLKSSLRPLKMASSEKSEIKLEILPLTDIQSKPKFVEANPNIPENPPDKKDQFSFRDQQAAQPQIIDKIKLAKNPKLKSQYDSQKIVEKNKEIKPNKTSIHRLNKEGNKRGDLAKLIENPNPLESQPITKAKTQGIQNQRKKMKNEPKKNHSFAALQLPDQTFTEQPNLSKVPPTVYPRTRPQLSKDLIHGPLMKSLTSAPRLGQISIECRLHPYGAYIQEMLQSIEEQWNQLARGSIQFLQRDRLPGRITLSFKLEANGRISELSRIDNEGYSLAAELCRQAIASRVPFGEWTEKMIKDFGQSDQITISFQYL